MAISYLTRLRNTTILASALICLGVNSANATTGSVVYQTNYVTQFGTAGSGNGQLNFNEQVIVGADGKVYVADRHNNRIEVFDKSGTYLAQFGGSGSGNGQFSDSFGIAFDGNNRVIASDFGNNRIQIFNSSTYAYVSQFNTTSPAGLAVNAANDIYVMDYSNSRLVIYDQTGAFKGLINGLNGALGVAVASDGKIYISEESGSDVKIYDASYNLIGTLASGGSGAGQVNSPIGLSVDKFDNVYVADQGNNRISVFNKNGVFLFSYGSAGNGNGQFSSDRGIFADSDGKIYVSDTGNSRIQVIQASATETFSTSPASGNETAVLPSTAAVLTNSGVFANNFIGYSNLTVNGTNWNLSGTSSFTNDVDVNTGILSNNGTITAPTTIVAHPATLQGTGTFVGNVVNSGTIAPGNSIGTLHINGNYTHNSNATYQVEANAAGQSDLIAISGTANLAGGLVNVVAANGNYNFSTRYTILTAGSGITGTFATVTSNLAFLDAVLDYSDPNSVQLSLTRNDGVDFNSYARSPNQEAVAGPLSTYSFAGLGGNTATNNALLNLNKTEANEILSQVSPDEIAAQPQVQNGLIKTMQTPLFQRLSAEPVSYGQSGSGGFAFLTPQETVGGLKPDQVWLETIGGVANQDSTSNGAAGYRMGTVGMRGGADKDISAKTKMGISVAYAHGTADYKDSSDKSETQYAHMDLYGRHVLAEDGVLLEGFAGAGGGRIDSTRFITAGGLNQMIQGNTNAYDVSGAVRASMPGKINDTDTIIPNITGNIAWTRQNAFTETGSSPFNLHMDSITATPITITPMINWQRRIQNEKYSYDLIPDLGVGATWQLTELDNKVNANFSNATSVPGFTVSGAKQNPLSLNLTASVTMQPFSNNKYIPQLMAQATAQANDKSSNGTATLTAKWDW